MPRMVPLTCSQCGKEFERVWWEVERYKAKYPFCSKACQLAALSWHNPKSYQQAKINELSDTQAAWLAAMIDAEGCIIFPRDAQGNTRHERVRVQMNMTDEAIMRNVGHVVGKGAVRFKKRQLDHHRDQWFWCVVGPNAAALLRRIYPWLIVKRERALRGVGQHFSEAIVEDLRDATAWDFTELPVALPDTDHWQKKDNGYAKRKRDPVVLRAGETVRITGPTVTLP